MSVLGPDHVLELIYQSIMIMTQCSIKYTTRAEVFFFFFTLKIELNTLATIDRSVMTNSALLTSHGFLRSQIRLPTWQGSQKQPYV